MATIDLLMDKITLGKPIIGLTCNMDGSDHQQSSSSPSYILRSSYCNAVSHAGGVPILLPYHPDVIGDYIDLVDGIVVTGGGYEIDPKLFGDQASHPNSTLDPERTKFEWALIKASYQEGKSILGIGSGMRLLNVVLGGTLRYITSEDTAGYSETNATHPLQIVPQTSLDRLTNDGSKNISVNNNNHLQVVNVLANRLKVCALAPNNIIEAIEGTDHPFCLGVQWHPEYENSDLDKAIFKAFIKSMSH